jgi:hypothetical protein
MKFAVKDVIIGFLLLVILFLVFPRILSFASEMSAPAPAPEPAAAPATGCLPDLYKISDLCPSDHPHTGDITADGMKYCCK